MGDEQRFEFRDALTRFVRIYSFVSQIAALTDPGLERDYIYCRALSLYLRDTNTVERLDLGAEVELTHLRRHPGLLRGCGLGAERALVAAPSRRPRWPSSFRA